MTWVGVSSIRLAIYGGPLLIVAEAQSISYKFESHQGRKKPLRVSR